MTLLGQERLTRELWNAAVDEAVRIQEYIPLGQRVEAFALDQWKDGAWREFAKGTSIGSRRLVRVPPVATAKVRLRITKAPVTPALAEVGLYAEPH